MRSSVNDSKLTIFLDGRIDTNNAAQTEKDIFAVTDGTADEIVIDAKELEYISSAGLRVLMKLRKTIDKPLPMINVSRDVYDILETTGFTELLAVKKALRKVEVAGLEVIGKGGHGKVFRLDEETIIKTYHDNSSLEQIEKERQYARNAFVNGIPSAIAYDVVETEEGYGVVFEMAGAVTVSKAIMDDPGRTQELAVKFGKLLKQLNTTEANPSLYGDIKQIYLGRAKSAEEFFTPEENEQIVRMINAIPDGNSMIHGDYHTNNVMVQSDGELILIDMADISRGNPLYDIGGTFLTMYLSGMNDPNITLEKIGIEYEKAKQVWGIALATYYGTNDPKMLELYSNRCSAFALMRMATTLGFTTGAARNQYAEGIVALMRQQLFPNTENFCKLFAMPC
ncbi:phosphotransferase [uncultured Ruminococcus sp.]|uniref:phosphotransferase n=1 Tax=uncultured Ruminococcus sp. TaxID=165186 RepID=UPI0025D39D5D|nr:phosphotransferase [uncultured Ruminococcus sp.]